MVLFPLARLFNFWPQCTHCGIHHPPAIPCSAVTLPWDVEHVIVRAESALIGGE